MDCQIPTLNGSKYKHRYCKNGNYYFIATGDFDLVPINIATFIIGHILIIPAIYVWFFLTSLATQIYGKTFLLIQSKISSLEWLQNVKCLPKQSMDYS